MEHMARGPPRREAGRRLRISIQRNRRPVMAVNLRALVARLNSVCKGAMEGAAGLCLSRTHYDVEIEHLLVKLLETENTDFSRILRQFEVAPDQVRKEL